MVAAALETGGLAETDDGGVGEERKGASPTNRNHWAACHKGQGQDAAAVVCERPGSDDGGDPRPGGVPDGVAIDERGVGACGVATQEADRADVCPGGEGGDGARVSAVSQGEQAGGVVR